MQKRYGYVLDTKGNPVAGATIAVTVFGSVTVATLYSDSGGVTQIANPVSTDAEGYYEYYAANGRYTENITTNAGIETISDILLQDVLSQADQFVVATGTGNAMVVSTFSSGYTLEDGDEIHVRAPGANSVTNPTISLPGAGTLTIYKVGGIPLQKSDIKGAGHELILRYRSSPQRMEFVSGDSFTQLSIANFSGVDTSGSLDCSSGFSLANTAANGRTLFWPSGTYKVSNNVTFDAGVTHFFEKGAALSVDSGKTVTFNGAVVALYGNVAGGAGTTTFGSDGNVFFNSSGGSGGFGFGTKVPSGTDDFFHIQRNVNTSVGVLIKNEHAGSAAETFIHLFSDVADAGGDLRFSCNSVAGGSLVDIVAGQNTVFSIIQKSNADIDFYTGNAKMLTLKYAASVVNRWEIVGGATGSSIQATAVGANTDVSMILNSKGAGSIFFRTDGGNVFQAEVVHVAGATRRVTMAGSNGGNPKVGASGGKLNINSGVFNVTGIPTSSAGLSAGDVWANAGILTVA